MSRCPQDFIGKVPSLKAARPAQGFQSQEVNHSMRVLIVDDEKSALKAMACFLDHSDLEIMPVTDSADAAQQIIDQDFDAMIIDVHMPFPDGIELTRLARRSSLNRRTPIALITGDDDIRIRCKGLEAGATCFAAKPFTPKIICGILHVLQGDVSSEQRREGRWPFRTQVQCRWGSAIARSLLAESLSLGQSGMSLEPSGGLKVGEEMELEFKVPSLGRPLLLRAKVARFELPDRVAVQFLGVADQDHKAIQSYISQHLQR
jgi:CheY-like chemotaxis protein